MNIWLERYLQAVRKHLPWERQDDIIAELRANLESQLEEREGDLGRPLSEGEMIDWLKQIGPPMVMASRYQPARHLIGPNLFPMYWMVLRLAVLWVSVAYAVSIAVRMIVESHTAQWMGMKFGEMPGVWLQSAAWVTLAFAAIEYASSRFPEKCPAMFATGSAWSPTSLPPLEKPKPAKEQFKGQTRSYAGAVAEFVVHAAVVVWLLLIPSNPWLMFGPAAVYLHDSPVILLPVILWFYWAVVAANALRAGWLGYLLVTEEWRYKTTAQHLVMKVIEAVPTFILICAPGQQYVMGRPGAHPLPGGLQIDTLNHYIWLAFVVIGVIAIIQLIVDVFKSAIAPRGSKVAAMF